MALDAIDTSQYRCEDCEKLFAKRMHYNRHRKQHDKPYKCLICTVGFALKNDLKRHQSIVHLALQKLKCSFSGCKFKGTTRKDYLWKHMRVKHGEIATSRPKFDTTVASSSHKSEEVEYLEAIGEENTEKLMRMARPYPDFKFARGANALQIAVSAEKFKSVQVLLDAGLDASLKDMWGTSALDTAIEKKLVETVQLILSYTSDISKRIRLSSEGLHIAARFGHMETVKCLIDDGADINMPDPTLQNAPLHLAAYNGHCSVMQLLISKGANLEATEINSKTPLWRAIEGYIRYSKLCNLDAIALLLEAGANVEARSNPTTWESLLEYTVRLCEPQDKAIKATKLLLEYGARIWCSNRGKSLAVTPSRFAAAICPPTLVNEIEIRSRKAVVANGISRGRVR